MATNLQIDDALLLKAQKVGGFRTKKETVNRALADFVRRHEQAAVVELFGSLEIPRDFRAKTLRAKR